MAKEYIERKAIYDKLEKEKEYAKELWELKSNANTIEKDMRWGIYCGFSHAIRMVNSIPAADVEEVRHGRWEEAEDDYYGLYIIKCSECREEWCFEVDYDVKDLNYNYCPNCGALMVGESNDKCE